MNPSWTETEKIDRYLRGHLTTADSLLIQARLIVDTDFRENVDAQRLAHSLIRQFALDKLRATIEEMHTRFLKNLKPETQAEIKRLF